MIGSFRHTGLQRLYPRYGSSRLPPEQVDKINRILARLDQAATPADMRLPGFHRHALTGALAGHWSARVSGNWRITFRIDGQDAHGVDLIDCHQREVALADEEPATPRPIDRPRLP